MAEEFKHIVRIVNTDIDGNLSVANGLTRIKGVGVMIANMACHVAKVDKTKKTGTLADDEVDRLTQVISRPDGYDVPEWLFNRLKDPETGEDRHLTASDLKFANENDIKQMKKIKCYRGVRHMFSLPSRGQRTKSNFRRNKGKVQGVKRKK